MQSTRRRRLPVPAWLVATTVALATLVAAPSGSSGPLDPAPAAVEPGLRLVDQPVSADVTTFTLNVAFSLPKKKAAQDVERALTRLGAQIGGFQEFSGPGDRAELMRLATLHDWGWYMPEGGGISTPVVWDRSRFRLIDGRTLKVHDSLGKHFPSRWINVVRLRETATGKVFGVINTHTIARASFDAQPHDRNGDASRTDELRKHLKMLRREIVRLHEQTEFVVATGDLNVNYLADVRRRVAGLPTHRLGSLVSFNMPFEGSHGAKSLLDYNMTVKPELGSGYLPVEGGARIERGFHSDHDAVVVTYRPIDLFADGPVFNELYAGAGEARTVAERAARVARGTEAGAELRVAAPRITDGPLTRALVAAARRGVQVQVLLDGAPASKQERRLARVLPQAGPDSWVRTCGSSCTPEGGQQRMVFLAASRTGAADTVVLQASDGLTDGGQASWTDGQLVGTPELYAAYVTAFDQLAGGGTPPAPRAKRGYRVSFRTVDGKGRDLYLRTLASVRCSGSSSPRTPDGRTDLQVVVGEWRGARGRDLAERVAAKHAQGCDVRVVHDRGVPRRVLRVLDSAGVPRHADAVDQVSLLVDGRIGKQRNRSLLLTGTQGWVPAATRDASVVLQVRRTGVTQTYRERFERLWSRK